MGSELKVYKSQDEQTLLQTLNSLPNCEVLSVYGVHGFHFAWVRMGTETREPKKRVKRELTSVE